jgi:hypothetical protein
MRIDYAHEGKSELLRTDPRLMKRGNNGGLTMRPTLKLMILVVAIGACSSAIADEAFTVPPKYTVYLNGPSDLARLRDKNPDHYARAERILAAANHLCRPGPGQLQEARKEAPDVACDGSLLRTSNPPKWEIIFRLDDTRYVALVAVTDDPPRPTPAAR